MYDACRLGPTGVVHLALAIALLSALGVPHDAAAAGPWSFAAGGGLASAYRAAGLQNVDGTAAGVLAVQRAVNHNFWVRGEAAYLAYQGSEGNFRYYGIAPARAGPAPVLAVSRTAQIYRDRTSIRATFVPTAAGFRWQPPAQTALGVAPWLDFMPSLTVTRWSRRFVYREYRYGGSDSTFAREQAFTRLLPGVMLGFGLHFYANEHWNVDYGVRYVRTGHVHAPPITTPDGTSRDVLDGLSTWILAATLAWTP